MYICIGAGRASSETQKTTQNPQVSSHFLQRSFRHLFHPEKKKRFALRYTAGLRSLIQRVVQPILLSAILTPIHLHSDLIPRSPRGLISINHASHESARPAFLPR